MTLPLRSQQIRKFQNTNSILTDRVIQNTTNKQSFTQTINSLKNIITQLYFSNFL
ncbi:hypothetical protein FEM08_01290 [Flavobacterium gilvum]|nr:hypothetical protein FEM08_21270 [Flavobacterium gilvum]KFC61007.1 hypothetical protein FEM08_01290 [Flavobacterium gilvum]